MLFLIPILLFFAVCLLGCSIDSAPEEAWRVRMRTEIKKVFVGLPAPSEFRQTDSSEMIKPEGGSFCYGYEGKIDCEDVKEHYSNILLAKGWVLKEEDSRSILTGQTETELSYFKSEHRISITCEKKNSPFLEKEYSVCSTWRIGGY